jgi:hypothetical protein
MWLSKAFTGLSNRVPQAQNRDGGAIRDGLGEIPSRCESKARAASAADRAEESVNPKAAQAAERATS